MNDMNFLHSNFEGTQSELPPIVIVEDDKLLGLSIKKYLEQVLKAKLIFTKVLKTA